MGHRRDISSRSRAATLTIGNAVIAPKYAGASENQNRRKPAYVPDDPLLTAAEAAIETGRALSTFWRDVRAKLLPPAYYVTPKSPRWRRSELRDTVTATRAKAVP